MSVIVGIIIGGILLNHVIGTESLIVAVIFALIAAGILYHVADGVKGFWYYIFMAILSLGVPGVAEIIWSSGRSHITFWVVYAIVILVLIIDVKKSSQKAEKGSQEALKDLRDFLKDYSHFMTDHYRHAVISNRGGKLVIEVWTIGAELERNAYREFDQHNVDPTEHFFGSYKPESRFVFICYDLLEKGTPKYGENSLVYEYELYYGKASFDFLKKHLQLHFQLNYPDNSVKIGRESLSIEFTPTKSR